MPLLRSLEVLVRQQRRVGPRLILAKLAEDIRAGDELSGALARHPQTFDRLYVSMVRAGEAGGMVPAALVRLAQFQEKSLQVRSKVKAAMAYPLIVLGVAATILIALLVFVVPKFQQIFADMLKGAPLPALTQAVLMVSEVVRQHSWSVASGTALVIVGFQVLRRSTVGLRFWDRLAVHLPVFGGLILRAIVARFTRTLGTLLASGVPILPALLIARDACANARIGEAVQEVHDRDKAGASVAAILNATGVFPAMVASMVEVGEHAGQLPEMLHRIADIYEGEVDDAVTGLSALIEPILILLLALVVGTIVIALFLPIVRIVQVLT
jgi:type IV pilus assembly protein PilC